MTLLHTNMHTNRASSRSRSSSRPRPRPFTTSLRPSSRSRRPTQRFNTYDTSKTIPNTTISLNSISGFSEKDDLSLTQTCKPKRCECGCECCSDASTKILQELVSEHEQRERDMTLKLKEMEHTRQMTIDEINRYREKVEHVVSQLEAKNSFLEQEKIDLQKKVSQLEANLSNIKNLLLAENN
ncbi:hypothetical protein P9112_004152 [Eukaryota sp. TZLM1-RC]